MKLMPYLFFGGRTEEAIEFYKTALGAEVLVLMRFNEAPEQPPEGMLPAGYENKVMHSALRIGDTEVMASDGCNPEDTVMKGVAMALNVKSVADAERTFAALADGGEVTQPLMKTFFSDSFGSVTDKFGVSWMVVADVAAANAAAA
jgi:PhnB protein